MSKAAARGAIIKGGSALEQLARARVVLLDKTGTLTHGGPEISNVAYAPNVDSSWALRLIGSLEQHSPHVVAQALVGLAVLSGVDLTEATHVVEEHGRGLTGTVDGHVVSAGQPSESLPEWAQLTDSLLVAVHVDGSLIAVIGLDDPVRAESQQTIVELKN